MHGFLFMRISNTCQGFRPPWWLANGHLQTLYPALFRRVAQPPGLRLEVLPLPDGDVLELFHVGPKTGPLAIVLHGLTGNAQSGYIKGLQTALLQHGWRSVAVNFRGCGGQANNKARGYHSGETEDVHFVYQTLRQRELGTPMAAVGFSLGGNVLLKWLGEQQDNADLVAAVAVSVPLVLAECASKLDRGFAKIYRDFLLVRLKAYMRRKYQHLIAIGAAEEAEKLRTLGDMAKLRSFWQFDDAVVAPLHGFADVHDYYRRSSGRQFLRHITVPTLLIQADDDPFMTPAVLPEPDDLSAHVTLQVTRGGGHVGFITQKGCREREYWLDQRIPAFLHQYGSGS